jgi:hypothetical protein
MQTMPDCKEHKCCCLWNIAVAKELHAFVYVSVRKTVWTEAVTCLYLSEW